MQAATEVAGHAPPSPPVPDAKRLASTARPPAHVPHGSKAPPTRQPAPAAATVRLKRAAPSVEDEDDDGATEK